MTNNVDQITSLVNKIEEADAIVIGAASGMSSAAGHTFYYENNDEFKKIFGEFEEKYGIKNAFEGYYYPFKTRNEFWAYVATFINHIYNSDSGKPYKDLTKLLENKEYHILTTNQDTLFERDFPPEKISAIQGDWRYFQCKNRCHDEIYYNKDQVDKMYESIENCEIPDDLIPTCPVCGGEMEPWVRGLEFLEGKKYQDEYLKIRNFIDKFRDKKILFLELGVGRMTPMFIQEPFWQLTYQLPNAYYISINPNDALMPVQLKNKGFLINQDIGNVLSEAVKRGKSNE